jgi:phosphatidylserine decarboxylase
LLRVLEALPQNELSRLVRRGAQSGSSKRAIRAFAERYKIALEEAEKDIDEYGSLLEFFTRRLKPGLRPLDPDPRALLCPVDGVLDAGGTITSGRLIQAKGREYTLAALLASEDRAKRFEGGRFATLYLSPRDYHRVHSPATAVVTGATYVPGSLMPVNPNAVLNVDSLFSRNERLITHLRSEIFGEIDFVMVGATCVGHIKVVYDDSLATNCGAKEISKTSYDPPPRLERGAELGVFELGSTVILLVEPGVELDLASVPRPVRIGTRLGTQR